MNIETKSLPGSYYEYEKFGWKHTEETTVRVGRYSHKEHILARDKDMPNYALITALEAKYFSLKKRKMVYKPMDPGFAVAAFLFFIFPFIIYAAVKSSQKKKIASCNAAIQRQMNDVLKEVAPLL